jgi:hypothetical protein
MALQVTNRCPPADVSSCSTDGSAAQMVAMVSGNSIPH